MRRGRRFLMGLVAAVSVAVGISWIPRALSHVELFRVEALELDGARYLTLEEATSQADVAADANIWDDPGIWEARLRAHPLVSEARVRRRVPGTLVFEVKETEPMALLATPTLEPVDARGRLLPIDPAAHPLDLPIIQPTRGQDATSTLTPAQVRLLTGELSRLAALAPDFIGTVSEIALDEAGDVTVRLPRVEFRYRAPITTERLTEGLLVLNDAATRRSEQTPRAIDLRYADQVVVRFAKHNGR